MTKEKTNWVQIMLRMQVEDARRFDDAAHAARLPLAVFLRQLLLTGHTPKSAPPALNDLPASSVELIKICTGLLSNLTQIHAHAVSLGGMLTRLTGADGALNRMMAMVQTIGLKVKSGALNAHMAFQIWEVLEPAAQALNAELSRPLNEGREVTLDVWKRCLRDLQAALVHPRSEVTS